MTMKIIAEIGSNWEGDLDLAKLHIRKAKESGADYVKFQMWKAKDLYSSDHPEWEAIKKAELTENVAIELKKYSDALNIEWFCSVFNPDAVKFLETLDVPMYKIASRTSTLKDKFALETIKEVGNTGKFTFVSTGEGGNKEEISKLFRTGCLKFTYCVSKYPTEDHDINWNEILNYNFFSDHTIGITVPLVYAVMMRERTKNDVFIEKHTRFDNSRGPDAAFAITYDELKELTMHLKRIEKMI